MSEKTKQFLTKFFELQKEFQFEFFSRDSIFEVDGEEVEIRDIRDYIDYRIRGIVINRKTSKEICFQINENGDVLPWEL